MQIIIPMSGFGERFRKVGYKVPKPLIEIEGKPIIAHVIDMIPGVWSMFSLFLVAISVIALSIDSMSSSDAITVVVVKKERITERKNILNKFIWRLIIRIKLKVSIFDSLLKVV